LLALAAVALVGSFYFMHTHNIVSNEMDGDSDIQQQYNEFKKKYNKKYGSEEDSYRLQVYTQNAKWV
jgi:hypothetical protein